MLRIPKGMGKARVSIRNNGIMAINGVAAAKMGLDEKPWIQILVARGRNGQRSVNWQNIWIKPIDEKEARKIIRSEVGNITNSVIEATKSQSSTEYTVPLATLLNKHGADYEEYIWGFNVEEDGAYFRMDRVEYKERSRRASSKS